jgi:hypothetical protein
MAAMQLGKRRKRRIRNEPTSKPVIIEKVAMIVEMTKT